MPVNFDPSEFGKAMGVLIRDAVAPLLKRIEELEAREPVAGKQGEPGRDADPVDVDAVADAVVEKLLASDRLATLTDLAATQAVSDHFEANPVQHGKDGAPGKDGEPGKQGEPGKSVTIEEVSVFLDASVSKHVLDLERRAGDAIQRAIDKIPAPKDGKDGRDGVAMPTVEWDGERTLTIKAASGEVLQVAKLGVPLDRGYYRDGIACEKGDVVTHDGIAWIALRDTKAKPSTSAKEDWRILARKGRDGKDGRNGIDKTAPVKVGSEK